MHKSYKYILVFLTTVLIFSTIFNVQKASANSSSKTIIYDLSNITNEDYRDVEITLTFDESYNMQKDIIAITYKFYDEETVLKHTNVSNFTDSMYVGQNSYGQLSFRAYSDYSLKNKNVRFEIIFQNEEDLNFVESVKISRKLTDKTTFETPIIITENNEIKDFLQVIPPLQLMMEELPGQVLTGAMTILPVGLVVLSILLGIVLIPRLINYFRH